MGWFRPANPKPGQKFKAVYRDADGRQRSRTFQPGQKQLATRWLKERETEVAKGTWRDPARERTPFEAWANEWLGNQEVRASSLRQTTYQLNRHLIPGSGGTSSPRLGGLRCRSGSTSCPSRATPTRP
jgi:hypothetical protein